jgi:alginate O-acetyltransferase complex protein AlgI
MVFSSHIFIYCFLPLTLLGYLLLRHQPTRQRNLWLALTGYTFYGWAEPAFVLLMFATTSLDWFLSLVIAKDQWTPWKTNAPPQTLSKQGARSPRQKQALTLSITSNLAALALFKYGNLGLSTLTQLCNALHLPVDWIPAIHFTLPLGISFYTFQALSYIIDVYRGDAAAMENFIDFSCFTSMLPHLVAGPILKFSFLAEQLRHRTESTQHLARGTLFLLLGLAKKIILANPCGHLADTAFQAAHRTATDAWLGAVGYSFQIYFDFSGYSDMAIGLGLMFGLLFAKNFDSPYLATSLTDFWRRWHISLSAWLREYLYIPLGGNRLGNARTYANLLLTMLLGGLWHGASWTFLLWGGIHGSLLALERFKARHLPALRVPRLLSVPLTFLAVTLAWILFRADSLAEALQYFDSLLPSHQPAGNTELVTALIQTPYHLGSLVLASVVAFLAPQTWNWTRNVTTPKVICAAICGIAALLLMATQDYNPFIYFIF